MGNNCAGRKNNTVNQSERIVKEINTPRFLISEEDTTEVLKKYSDCDNTRIKKQVKMGSEQSTERKQRDGNPSERLIQQMLEQQRKMYEVKVQEMLKKQEQDLKVKVAKEATELRARTAVQQAKLATQAPTKTTTNNIPLYPNLQQTPEHVQIQPSTSRTFHNTSILSDIQTNTRARNPLATAHNIGTRDITRNDASSNTSYNIQPSAPSSSLATEPAQSKTSGQKRFQNRNNDWKCISCNKCLGTKIFNCVQGHSSCSDCKFKGIKCGICRSALTDTRNISLENYIAEVKSNVANNTEVIIICPNNSDGCKLSLKQDRMEQHIKECPFREMTCPVASLYAGCLWKGKINHIREHFLDCHPEVTGTDVDSEASLNILNRNQVIHHVVMGNFHFLVYLKLDSQALYMTVQLIGSRNSASKWTYELHVYDKSEPRRKYLYTDICHPNNIPFSKICNESTCATLQSQYAMSFVKNNTLTYKFYIKKDVNDHVKRGGPKQQGRGRQS